MKLSVVIPALDEVASIGGTVGSARRASGSESSEDSENSEGSQATRGSQARRAEAPESGGPVEVVVVDGGSRDGTPEQATRAGARVVSSAPGRAHQLAVGARASSGDVLVFLHADTQLPAGWDLAIERALRDPAVVGGAFRLRFDRRGAGLRVVEWGARARVALFGMPYGDQALFVRRRVLDGIGGVPQAPIMEDLDLVKAMKRRGRLALLPLCAVTSSRRYREGGVLRTMLRHWLALLAWSLGIDRARVAAWYGR